MPKFKGQKRNDRRARYVIQVRDWKGRVRTKSFVNKSDAKRYYNQQVALRQRIRAKLERPESDILFFDLSAEWMRARIKDRPEPTWRSDETKLRRVWVPAFGKRVANTIETKEIQTILDELRVASRKKPVSPIEDAHEERALISAATYNRHRALLHTVFAWGIKQKYLIENPVSNVPVRSEKVKSRPQIYLKEREHAEAYIAGHYQHGQVFGVFAECLTFGGPRSSELLAIRWENVGEKGGVITLKRIIEVRSGQARDRTKGQREGGQYVIPIFDRVGRALAAWKRVTPFSKESDYVFCDGTGRHLTYWQIHRVHKLVIKEEGLPEITPHKLRHFYASELERAGFNRKEIQLMLGHEDARTTENYVHAHLDQILERGAKLGFGRGEEQVKE